MTTYDPAVGNMAEAEQRAAKIRAILHRKRELTGLKISKDFLSRSQGMYWSGLLTSIGLIVAARV